MCLISGMRTLLENRPPRSKEVLATCKLSRTPLNRVATQELSIIQIELRKKHSAISG